MSSFGNSDSAARIKQLATQNLLDLKREELARVQAALVVTQEAFDAYQAASAKKLDLLLNFIQERLGDLPEEVLEIVAERAEQRIEASTVDVTGPILPAGDGQVLRRSGDIVEFASPPLAVKPP